MHTMYYKFLIQLPDGGEYTGGAFFVDADLSNKELKTYPSREFAPDPIPDLTGLNAETNNNVYLQAAFFHKENETEQTKYFMIVNRRCSPFIKCRC